MLAASFNSYSAVRYISDDIYVFLLAGPGTQYRITGTIKVGEKVDTLKYDAATKFMRVKTRAGKIGWVKNSELQQGLPAKIRLPAIQKQLTNSKKKLSTIADDNKKSQSDSINQLSTQTALIEQLQTEKASLEQTITSLKARNLELDLLQDTKEDRVKMEWMINGGAVLFFGLLLGLLVPLIPRRKKKKNNW
ncbi:MAG: TIGR04211 family SH3 domain-containing protein [Psychromonas sp.]|nr:TIGR04211 family SH3 domain-containing protein [Psychromonas sp.]